VFELQRFLRFVSGTDRYKTGTHRPGLFYDVFDKNFVLKSTKTYDILKILIKKVIKQPGPVGAGLMPVRSGQGRSVPVGTHTYGKVIDEYLSSVRE
jgi:hypothetical protein